MTEYISLETAIKAAMQDTGFNRSHEFNAGCARAANNLKAIPTADVAPVVHAEWILTTTRYSIDGPEYFTWNCSHCGYRRKRGQVGADNNEKPKGLFCERCGAIMDVEVK